MRENFGGLGIAQAMQEARQMQVQILSEEPGIKLLELETRIRDGHPYQPKTVGLCVLIAVSCMA